MLSSGCETQALNAPHDQAWLTPLLNGLVYIFGEEILPADPMALDDPTIREQVMDSRRAVDTIKDDLAMWDALTSEDKESLLAFMKNRPALALAHAFTLNSILLQEEDEVLTQSIYALFGSFGTVPPELESILIAGLQVENERVRINAAKPWETA